MANESPDSKPFPQESVYPIAHRCLDWIVGTVLFNRLAVAVEGAHARLAGRTWTTEMTFQASMVLALLFGGLLLITLALIGYYNSTPAGHAVRIIALITTVILIPVSIALT